MWSRFQIGSNSPLAKRKARMFCAASLPRKWSIRKIWFSRNVSCRVDQVRFAKRAHDAASCAGWNAQVVEAPRFTAEFALSCGHGRHQARRPVARPDETELSFEGLPLLGRTGPTGELVAGGSGGHQTGPRQMEQAG